MSEEIPREPGPPAPEPEDHWLKLLFRRLPLWVRLTVVALITVFLIALPLLILFGPRAQPAATEPAPLAPAETAIEEPAPSAPPPVTF